MSNDWREKLKHLLAEMPGEHGKAQTAPVKIGETFKSHTVPQMPNVGTIPAEQRQPTESHRAKSNGGAPAIDVHLGIDFGTRFTKVGIYLPHIQRRGVLKLTAKGSPLLSSRVVLGNDDRLYFVNCPGGPPKLLLEYIKIRLANPAAEAFGTTMDVDGVPFKDAIRAIAAFYLASVLRLAKGAAKLIYANELGQNRKINWLANIGVPVKHCDSDILRVFREVSAVSWIWHDRPQWAPRASELLADFERTVSGLDAAELPIQVVPELAAALIHFAEHRNTAPGLYAFLDIGGGTLDGSVFRLRREREGSSFDILAADVAELGTMAVARHIVADAHNGMPGIVETPLIVGGASPNIVLPIKPALGERVQTLFASVIGQARQKVGGELFLDGEPANPRPGLNKPKPPIVPVYLAGGGSPSEWYRKLFNRTYDDFNHKTWGIGGYHIQTVPAPSGFNTDDYPRFVIAAGLTSDALHFDKYKLPSRTSPAPPPPQRTVSATAYEDTKSLV